MTRLLIAIALAAALALTGCAQDSAEPSATSPDPPATGTESPSDEPAPAASELAWLDIELTDAVSGEEFRLTDYKGKPLLLHSFAVW